MTDLLPITWSDGEPEPGMEKRLASARRCFSLEKVLHWMREAGGSLADVVVQDEYTHDVVIELDGFWVVFDTT